MPSSKQLKKFSKIIKPVIEQPGKTGPELQKLGWNERRYGSLRDAHRAGVIEWSLNGGWYVPADVQARFAKTEAETP